jgi:hypothetical protein
MMNGDIFLAGMITGVVLCAMIAVAYGYRPRRRQRLDPDFTRQLDESYQAGRQRGLEESISGLTPRPRQQVLTVVRRTDRGWMGTTAAVAGLTSDDGKGAA